MSQVKEVFSEILQLPEGKKILIEVENEQRLASIRTQLHRERKEYEKATGSDFPMTCTMVKNDLGKIFLEIKNEPLKFEIVEDNNA